CKHIYIGLQLAAAAQVPGIALAACLPPHREMPMATMKAICLTAFGGPETLKVCEMERPRLKEDELLIRVRAASVNPVDYKIRAGHYPPVKADQLPLVLGRDIAGTVVACGSSVMNFEEGDEVYAMLDGGPGGYAEY